MNNHELIWNNLDNQWKHIILKNIIVQKKINQLPDKSFWNGISMNFEKLDEELTEFLNIEILQLPKKIDIYSSNISSLQPLQQTVDLEEFYCGDTLVDDLSPLNKNKNLSKLCCYNTPLTHINGVEKLMKLQRLCISKTNVTDITPISSLFYLEKLALYKTNVSDLRPVASLKRLKKLNINFTPIKDISPLYELNELVELHCYETDIHQQDIEYFKKLRPECLIINDYEQPENEYDDFE